MTTTTWDDTRSPWDTVVTLLDLRARMDRLVAAEDRAFVRYMNGTGSAATARKAQEHGHCGVCHLGVHRYAWGWEHTSVPDQRHEPEPRGIHCSCVEKLGATR